MGNCCGKKEVMVLKNDKLTIRRHRNSIFNEKITKFSDYKLKYEYLSLIGSGGFGKVRLFRDRNCETLKYAIKTLKKDFLNSHSIQCIIDEVKILRSVDHPNIVKYFETYEDEHFIHIVMEYIPGNNLFEFILRDGENNKIYANNINKENENNNFVNKDKHREKDKNNKENEDKHPINFIKENEFKANYHNSITTTTFTSRKKRLFTENEICQLVISILKAILFLHRANIIHRDLKPENILFSNPDDFSSVKLIDFGLSVFELRVEKYRVGSPYYMAPEMIDGSYSKASDMWSIGVILYLILTGKQPFQGLDQTEVYRKIKKGVYDKKLLKDNKWSSEIGDFVEKLLLVSETERMKSEEVFEHPWISKFSTQNFNTAIINESIIESLRSFSKNNILQKEILFYLARISNEKEILELKKAFDEIDENNTGVIEYTQLENTIKKLKIKAGQVIFLFPLIFNFIIVFKKTLFHYLLNIPELH